MKQRNFLILAAFLAGCSPDRKNAENTAAESSASVEDAQVNNSVTAVNPVGDTTGSPIFHLPEVPILITDSIERLNYLASHYWDCILPPTAALPEHEKELEQAWADYCNLLSHLPLPQAQKAISTLLPLLEQDLKAYTYFKNLAEKYLDNPNSPFRNEELYIPVLKSMISSSTLGDMDKPRWQN